MDGISDFPDFFRFGRIGSRVALHGVDVRSPGFCQGSLLVILTPGKGDRNRPGWFSGGGISGGDGLCISGGSGWCISGGSGWCISGVNWF